MKHKGKASAAQELVASESHLEKGCKHSYFPDQGWSKQVVCTSATLHCFSRKLGVEWETRLLAADMRMGGENSTIRCWGPVAAAKLCLRPLFINYSPPWQGRDAESIRVHGLFATTHNSSLSQCCTSLQTKGHRAEYPPCNYFPSQGAPQPVLKMLTPGDFTSASPTTNT